MFSTRAYSVKQEFRQSRSENYRMNEVLRKQSERENQTNKKNT